MSSLYTSTKMKHDLGEQAAKLAGGVLDTAKEKRTALVTGGSRGLGRAMALELAGAGAHVAVNYFNRRDAAEQTCATIRQSGGHARAFPADVRDESEVARLVQEVNGAFGAVDILVVNATGSQPFFSIEEQTWHCARRWSKAP